MPLWTADGYVATGVLVAAGTLGEVADVVMWGVPAEELGESESAAGGDIRVSEAGRGPLKVMAAGGERRSGSVGGIGG